MDKDGYTKAMVLYSMEAISLSEFTEFCMTYIKELEQQNEVLNFKMDTQNAITHEYSNENVNLARAMGFIK